MKHVIPFPLVVSFFTALIFFPIKVGDDFVHDLINPSGRDLKVRQHPQLGLLVITSYIRQKNVLYIYQVLNWTLDYSNTRETEKLSLNYEIM